MFFLFLFRGLRQRSQCLHACLQPSHDVSFLFAWCKDESLCHDGLAVRHVYGSRHERSSHGVALHLPQSASQRGAHVVA